MLLNIQEGLAHNKIKIKRKSPRKNELWVFIADNFLDFDQIWLSVLSCENRSIFSMSTEMSERTAIIVFIALCLQTPKHKEEML